MDELQVLAGLAEEAKVAPMLRINFKPFAQIHYWTQAAKGEVSGWGKARKDEDGGYTVTDIILPEQVCTGGFTDFTDEAITDFLFYCGKYGRNPAEYNFWWHSHCNFGTFWSGTDQGTMLQYSQKQPFIALVTNKRGDMLASHNFRGEGFGMSVSVLPTGHQDVQRQCYQEVQDRVKEMVIQNLVYTPSFGGSKSEEHNCGNCVHPVDGVCEFAGEISTNYCCNNWRQAGVAPVKECSLTEMWDDDCGWRYSCTACGKLTRQGKKAETCLFCGAKFTSIERV